MAEVAPQPQFSISPGQAQTRTAIRCIYESGAQMLQPPETAHAEILPLLLLSNARPPVHQPRHAHQTRTGKNSGVPRKGGNIENCGEVGDWEE